MKKSKVQKSLEQIQVLASAVGFSIVLSILALLLSITAYNRSGMNLTQKIEQSFDQLVLSSEDTLKLAEIQAKVSVARAQFIATQNYQQANNQIQEIRAELQDFYQQTQGEAVEMWQELDQDLAELESKLSENSADSIDYFQTVLENFEQNLRRD